MKKYYKRIISLFLVVLMLIPMISTMGFTSSAETYSGTCGGNLTWTLDISTGVLDIAGAGAMVDYSDLSSAPWYYYCSYVKTVNIGNGVTNIGNRAFYECTNLTSVTIPNSVTRIGDHAFYKCTGLTSVTIPNSVTRIDNDAFYYCTGLTSVIIPDSVTRIGSYAFFRCTGLISITIGKSVSYIDSYAFYDCTSLKNVTIPDNITGIGHDAFYFCLNLERVTIGSGVTYIGDNAFHYYSNGKFYRLDMIIACNKDTYAHNYAINNGFDYILLCDQHSFTNYVYDNNATCTANGTKTACCDNGCGIIDTVVMEGSAIGHGFTNYINDNNTDCIHDGTETSVCDNGCGATDTRIIEGSAWGHSFTDYEVVSELSCTENRIEESYCDNGCGEKDVIIEETKGHSYSDWIVIKKPDYYNDGYKVKSCTVCSEILDTEILTMLIYEGFPDVWENSWYSEGIEYCFKHGYIFGTDEGLFKPNVELTREQFVVIFARIHGAKLSEYTESSFDDINADSWYGSSVAWAKEEGLVYGIGNGKFGVGRPMTREQFAVIFYRYAEKQGIDVIQKTDLSYCDDADNISTWAVDACAWAIKANLLGSTSETANLLSPKMTVTRAQAAKIFMSYDKITETE